MKSLRPTPEQSRLLKLQMRIYRSLQKEADRLLGDTPEAIRRYETAYRKDFAGVKLTSSVTKRELIESIRSADITLIADYHSFDQAQKTALRLMRDVIRPRENWAIGLEMVPSHLQWAIDRFQAGEMDLDSFHQAIRYREEWGFPWRNYAPIFEWARQAKVRIVALNRPRELAAPSSASLRSARKKSDLYSRDQWAAGVITDYFTDQKLQGAKPLKMLVLYGELHVARAHLPEQIRRVSRNFLGKPLTSISIHQNNDSVYWKLARLGREHQANVLKLKRSVYCVVSATPWTRLQSLINWAEGEAHQLLPGDDEFEGESGGIDYLSAIRIYGELIAEFLQLPKPDFSTLSVLTLEDADFVDGLAHTGYFKRREIRVLKDLVLRNERFYVPKVTTAYLGSPSYNAAAETAAIHLLRTRTRALEFFEGKIDDFYRLVVEAGFGFFGSLVINPRRKCDLPRDHGKRVEQYLKLRRPDAETREEILARQRAPALLKSRNWPEVAVRTLEEDLATPGMDQVMLKLARYVGQPLGARAYQAVVSGKLPIEAVKQAFLARAEGGHRSYKERYESLVDALASSRLPESKSERL